ncbi:MAG: hypothetical protein E7466_01210 [Ruminococcaceae bacterium]|nr:hypothetical protein [Oscillospiraceae bacterium]MBQ3215601.1 hypothetical protein [Oscillospiraceae bacterium]
MNDEKMISSIVKTVQMGQFGIRCVQEKATDPQLKLALRDQLKQYDTFEEKAYNLAQQKGWNITPLDPSIQRMSAMMTRMRLIGGHANSKIAEMLVQGNTKGMIKSTRDLHRSGDCDPQLNALAHNLIDSERSNIRQASQFL